MLILGRKQGEEIKISEDIYITIVSISEAGTVRLGITATKDVSVVRSELVEDETDA